MQRENRCDEFISEQLSDFLSSSRLSMHQIARKWNVSTPALSQIKNKKRSPSIELGLKILRESGADFQTQKEWIRKRIFENNDEVRKFEDEERQRDTSSEISMRPRSGCSYQPRRTISTVSLPRFARSPRFIMSLRSNRRLSLKYSVLDTLSQEEVREGTMNANHAER